MKPHIVQVITELKPAGAERILANLSIALKKQGFEVTVVSLQSEPSVKTIVEDLINNEIEIFYLNITWTSLWRIFRLKSLIEKIRNKSPSEKLIVHSHLMHANLACRFAKLIGGEFNLINTIHTAEKRDKQQIFFLLDKLTIKFCDIYTAVSIAAKNFHADKLKIFPTSIQVVHNGIQIPKKLAEHQKDELITQWGFKNCKKIIGSVGRLDSEKGYDIFLNILPKLSKAIPHGEKWGVVILGEGKQRPNLEALSKNVPSNIKIIFPGYRQDAAECINAFNLFVMPSNYEGFGLTLIEAIACGVPILSSNADSLCELIKISLNGKCINFSNSTQAVNEIIECIQKPAVKNDVSSFTVEKMTNNYIKLYSSF